MLYYSKYPVFCWKMCGNMKRTVMENGMENTVGWFAEADGKGYYNGIRRNVRS